MQCRITLLVVASLIAVGCSDKTKELNQAAAAKSAEEAEIDQRAGVVAQDMIRKAAAEAEAKRRADKQQEADARKQMRQTTIDNPGKYLKSSKLQMVNEGKRHLTSIAMTNGSQFSMTDIRGTVDYHGGPDAGPDVHSDNDDVLARVPVELTGTIVPGASMVFSEQQHTLSGAAIQVPKEPSFVTFTVTSVTVGMEGIDTTAAPSGADAGADAGGAP